MNGTFLIKLPKIERLNVQFYGIFKIKTLKFKKLEDVQEIFSFPFSLLLRTVRFSSKTILTLLSNCFDFRQKNDDKTSSEFQQI